MAFYSKYADRIWNDLYTCYIPDILTLNPDYIRIFGIHTTGDKKFDNMLQNTTTMVKLSIAKILEYFLDGIEIQIPSRQDLINIHKNIELYLAEWKEHLKYDINLNVEEYKELIIGLEKLSKHIYAKANPKEILDDLLISKKIGIINPLAEKEKEKNLTKPNYDGISSLLKKKAKGGSRF